MDKDYQKLLEQLVSGELAELDVEQNEIQAFQPVLMEFHQRNSIVGRAKRGGGVSYHYSRDGI